MNAAASGEGPAETSKAAEEANVDPDEVLDDDQAPFEPAPRPSGNYAQDHYYLGES